MTTTTTTVVVVVVVVVVKNDDDDAVREAEEERCVSMGLTSKKRDRQTRREWPALRLLIYVSVAVQPAR